MKTSCECCAKSASCPLQYDEERRAQCPILNADNEPLRYRNSEGYSDPYGLFRPSQCHEAHCAET